MDKSKKTAFYKVQGLKATGGGPGRRVRNSFHTYHTGNGDLIGFQFCKVNGPQFLPRYKQRSLDEEKVDGAVATFNSNNRIEAKNIPIWIRGLKEAHGPEIPIVVWEIKSDHGDTSVSRDGNIQHCITDTTRGIEVPFLYLARVLTGNDNLVLQ